jgi:hypothetical protein
LDGGCTPRDWVLGAVVPLEGATRALRFLLIHPAALGVFDSIHPATVAAMEIIDNSFVGTTAGYKGAQHGCSRSKEAKGSGGVR